MVEKRPPGNPLERVLQALIGHARGDSQFGQVGAGRAQGDGHLVTYREYVESVASQPRPSIVISNLDAAHAAIVMERLFIEAQTRIEILTQCLTDEVYGGAAVIEAATAFLKRGGRLDVLTEQPISPETNLLLHAVAAAGFENEVTATNVPAAVCETYGFHFSVADGDCYRFEQEKDSWRAKVRFGDPEFGGVLSRAFADLRAEASSAQS